MVLSTLHSGCRFHFHSRSEIEIGADYPSSSDTRVWKKEMEVDRSDKSVSVAIFTLLRLSEREILTSHVPAPSSPEKTPLSDRGIVCGGGGAVMLGV